MTVLLKNLERWVRVLRQMAQNARSVAALSPEEPEEQEGWEQNARDLEAIATHLEDQSRARSR